MTWSLFSDSLTEEPASLEDSGDETSASGAILDRLQKVRSMQLGDGQSTGFKGLDGFEGDLSVLGTFDIDENTRLVARYYPAEEYKAKFLSDTESKLRKIETYHKGDKNKRGDPEHRTKYLSDFRGCSVDVSEGDLQRIDRFARREEGWQDESVKNVRVALGYAYPKSDVEYKSDDPTSLFHYARGYFFEAMHNEDLTISGRQQPPELEESTERFPCIDSSVRSNFGETVVPSENFDDLPRGVLKLEADKRLHEHLERRRQATQSSKQVSEDGATADSKQVSEDGATAEEDESKSNNNGPESSVQDMDHHLDAILDDPSNAGENQWKAYWTTAFNDSFYIGAVHEQLPVRLASKRSEENLVADPERGQLRIMGREGAQVFGPGCYELHSTSWGEAYVPCGAPEEMVDGYRTRDWLQVIEDHSTNRRMRQSLSWMHDIDEHLEGGEVVVTSREYMKDGGWVDPRRLGSLDG